jgi:predicted phage-related endonuclease
MIDTGVHRLYGPIKAHKKTQEKILAISEKFWWHVENDKPPKPNTWQDITSLFPNLDKESKTVIAGEDEEKVKQMKEESKKINKKIKELEERKNDIKNAIGLLLGENAILESATGESLAKAFNVKREYVDLKEMKKSFPQRYKNLHKADLINESISRQLRY